MKHVKSDYLVHRMIYMEWHVLGGKEGEEGRREGWEGGRGGKEGGEGRREGREYGHY